MLNQKNKVIKPVYLDTINKKFKKTRGRIKEKNIEIRKMRLN